MFRGSDSIAPDWQKKVDILNKQISEIEYKLKDVEEGQEVETTLVTLGTLRRALAEALWHINKAQDALQQIQLCVSENSHEFSVVSTQLSKTICCVLCVCYILPDAKYNKI